MVERQVEQPGREDLGRRDGESDNQRGGEYHRSHEHPTTPNGPAQDHRVGDGNGDECDEEEGLSGNVTYRSGEGPRPDVDGVGTAAHLGGGDPEHDSYVEPRVEQYEWRGKQEEPHQTLHD